MATIDDIADAVPTSPQTHFYSPKEDLAPATLVQQLAAILPVLAARPLGE